MENNMLGIHKEVTKDLWEERKKFVKEFLKKKRVEIETLQMEIDRQKKTLKDKDMQYETFLDMSIDDLYENYHNIATISGTMNVYFQAPNLFKED